MCTSSKTSASGQAGPAPAIIGVAVGGGPQPVSVPQRRPACEGVREFGPAGGGRPPVRPTAACTLAVKRTLLQLKEQGFVAQGCMTSLPPPHFPPGIRLTTYMTEKDYGPARI